LCLIVEGTLSGALVDEVEKCWLDAKSSPDDGKIRIDLSGVTYIDDKGRQFLKRAFQGGVELKANRVMTKGIIEEITAEKD